MGEDIQLDNPLVYLNSRDGNYKRRNFRSTFNGAITPLEGLTITGSYTYELTDDDNWEKPVYHDQWDFLHEQIVKHNTGRTWISNFNGKQERMFMDATIRYEDKVLNNRFSFSILAGASQELFRSYNMTAKKYNWVNKVATGTAIVAIAISGSIPFATEKAVARTPPDVASLREAPPKVPTPSTVN